MKPKEDRPYYLTVKTRFEGAHNLINYEGQCAALHGHSWKVRVTFGPYFKLDEAGIAEDFSNLKMALNARVKDVYDHQYLNEYFEKPTAENIAQAILKDLEKDDYPVESVEVWETRNNKVRV